MTQKDFFENFDKQTHSTKIVNYSEAAALQDLLRCINEEMSAQNYRQQFDDLTDEYSEFTISVAGRSVAFLLGRPQFEALYRFIEHIAAENLYAIDNEKLTVEE